MSWAKPTKDESELAASFIDRIQEDAYPNLVAVAVLSAEGSIDIPADFEVGLGAILERIREAG